MSTGQHQLRHSREMTIYAVQNIVQSIFSSASRPLDAGRKKRIIAAATVS